MPSPPRREQVLTTIVRVLGPYVGANMASAATRMHCDKLGLDGTRLEPEEIDRLLDALAPGLHVFIGKKKTEEAMYDIRKALEEGASR